MKRNNTPLSINFLYWLCNITLGGLILGFLFFLIVNIVLQTAKGDETISPYISVPIKFDLKETGSLKIDNQIIKLKLIDASSDLRFKDLPVSISKRFGFLPLLFIPFVFYFVFVFRKFIKNVKEGRVFTIKNIELLKRISYLLVAVWLIQTVVLKLIAFYLMKKMEFEQISLIYNVDFTTEIFNYRSTLFIAIFIWVLAHIFITGLKLQEEKDLTV